MTWLLVLLLVAALLAGSGWWWRQSRRGTPDAEGRIGDLRAAEAARRRLDEHRRDGGAGSGSGGVGAWDA